MDEGLRWTERSICGCRQAYAQIRNSEEDRTNVQHLFSAYSPKKIKR